MKLRIRPRMVAGFLLMSALLIIAGMLSLFYTNRMKTSTSRILAENVTSLKYSEELEIALMDMKGLTSNFLLDGDEKWLIVFAAKKKSFQEWYDKAVEQAHTKEEVVILQDIKNIYTKYLNYQAQVVAHYRQRNFHQAHQILTNDMRATFDLIYEKCEELLLLNEQIIYQTSYLIERDNRMVNRIIYSIGILGILQGIALGLILSRHITHSIYELVLKVKGATEEEIVEKVHVAEETELEDLGKHIRKLIDKVHKVNKDLERSQRMLIRSEKLAALGEMAAGLAHEIRNPLTAIKMLIFSLQNEAKKNNQISQDYHVIIKEIARMEDFLQNFLDFARPPEPNFGTIDINAVVRNTLNLLAPQMKSGKINLAKKLKAKNSLVYGDKEQLQIVLVNIILNALQATPEQGQISVETSDVDGANRNIQIKISDTGKGIPFELIDKVFDPFVTGKEKGSGLGLSIAYKIVHNHGGWIEAVNNADRGACFTVNLPINKGKNDQENIGRR